MVLSFSFFCVINYFTLIKVRYVVVFVISKIVKFTKIVTNAKIAKNAKTGKNVKNAKIVKPQFH